MQLLSPVLFPCAILPGVSFSLFWSSGDLYVDARCQALVGVSTRSIYVTDFKTKIKIFSKYLKLGQCFSDYLNLGETIICHWY